MLNTFGGCGDGIKGRDKTVNNLFRVAVRVYFELP